MPYTRLRLILLSVALALALVLLGFGGLPLGVAAPLVPAAAAAGYLLGARRWRRTRARIDRRNGLILYFSETWFYVVLAVLYAFKSFPLLAGWAVIRAYTYAIIVAGIITCVAWSWVGFAAAFVRGAARYERERGAIHYKFFHARSVTGQQGMIGLRGRVTRECGPHGKVELRGEVWDATSIDGAEIDRGTIVVVRDIEEMALLVERVGGVDGATAPSRDSRHRRTASRR